MPKLRKMLGKADSPYIVSLMRLIETQSKTTIAHWSVDYVEENILPIYKENYKNDERAELAIAAARSWLNGEIKFPEAKKFILDVHAAAREAEDNPAGQAAARAIGQGVSTIHVPTHALGIAFYSAAAVAYSKYGLNETPEEYDRIAAEVCSDIEESLRRVSVTDEKNPAKYNWNC